MGDGAARRYGYDANAAPASLVYPTGLTVTYLPNDYDQVGNVAAISDAVAGNRGNRDMAYDALNRLTGTTSPMFGTASYTYDVLDNLTHVQVTGGSQARNQDYCYDGANRLTNLKTGGCSGTSVIGLGYDVQGNLANKNGVLYGFDYGNRMRSGGSETYRYDAYGRRVRSINSTGGILYSLYGQAGQLLWQRDQRTSQRRNYVYLQGSLLAEHRRPIGSTTETIVYQHTDALGSPVATTDGAKTVLQRSEYEPYGYLLNRAMEDGPGYTGHASDAATGLVYMQQRYYDPVIGRFDSVDAVTALQGGPQHFNNYDFAYNNPYKFTDPDGRQSRCSGSGCAIVNLVQTLANTTEAISNKAEKVDNFISSAYEHSDIRLQVDGCSGGCVSVDQSILHGDGNISIAPIGWGGGTPSGGQGGFLGLVFGPREGVVLNDGGKAGADAPAGLLLGGEIKAAEGLGIAVQGEVNGSGKTTVNGGFVIGFGEVTKPVGIKVFNWDLKKKGEEQ